MREVLDFDLAYRPSLPWSAWESDLSARSSPYSYNQAQIGSLEFRPDGTLVVGLRNRTVDMLFPVTANGDLLPTERLGSDTWSVRLAPPQYDDILLPREEAGWGSLAPFPGLDRIVAAVRSPLGSRTPHNNDGAVWLDNLSGRITGPVNGREIVVVGEELGLGDIEALCPRSATTPTAQPSATPSWTATATFTVTPSATTTAAVTLTPTATPTVSPTASATLTPRPGRIYFP